MGEQASRSEQGREAAAQRGEAERSVGPREGAQASEGHRERLDIALGPGMSFAGLLVLPKPARIDGRVAGTVMAGASVWVGASGVVEADLEADTIVVDGTVRGDIRARSSIELGPDAVVDGDLIGPRMVVADGACVNGRLRCG
jgi:cytoskeletal protein CcmA (bactofilin family)